MENGPITVTPLSLTHASAPGPGPDFGARTADELAIQNNGSGLFGALQRHAKQAFCLEWEGNKVPRGAVVGAHTVAWTQNGQVVSDMHEMVGTYERIVEFGGESGRHHKMHVFLT